MSFTTTVRRLRAGSALPVLALGAITTSLLVAVPAYAQAPGSNAGTNTPDANTLATPAPVGSSGTTASAPTNGANAAPVATADGGSDIVVTGTLFRRTNTETPSPVTVLSAASIEQRGLTTVADAINTISATNGGGVPQGFLNAFASGAQGVSLRGLSTNSTLILFDGLRPAYYPLADDGQRSFADINTIPAAIVDRIETLRDGASSTYGADAVAGVVNVILKKEIKGINGRIEGGVSSRSDLGGQRLQLTVGHGDLAEQGYNFYISGEYQHSDALYARDRGFPYNTNNLSSITRPGGFTGANGNSNFLPPNIASPSSNIVATVRPANQVTPGNILSGVAIPAAAGGLYQVLGQGGCAASGLITHTNAAGTYCEQDLVNNYLQLQPDQQRFGGTAHLTVNINDDTQAYLVGTFYESIIKQTIAPSTLRSNNPIYTYGLVLPARLANGTLNPQDPFAAAGQAALLFYSFGDIPHTLKNTSKTYRIAGGIDGKIADGWDYTVHGTYMHTDLTQAREGYINLAGLTDAINNGTYNFINPAANSQAVRDQISPSQQSRAKSDLAEIQGVITHSFFDLPGGPLNIGVGGEIRYENINDPNPNPGNQFLTINTFQAVGHRYVESAFFEVNAPILKELEINASGRYDHYSTGFSHFSPKIGAKFTPIREFALRGTFSKGFRAPSIPETSGSVVGFTTYTPPADVSAAHGGNSYVLPYSVGLNSVGNPNLKPEKSRSFTGGFVAQPLPWLSFTVDYYNIKKTDVIYQTADTSYANDYLAGAALPAGITITPNAPDPEFPNLRPTPLFVNGAYANGQSQKTSGIDAQIQLSHNFGNGIRFTSSAEATRILKFNQTLADGTVYRFAGTLGPYSITSASGTPKWRGNWQNTLEVKNVSFTTTAYYTDGYAAYADDYVQNRTCAAGTTPESSVRYNGDTSRVLGPALQCRVHHFVSIDMTGSIKVNDQFSLYVNVFNVFDKKAPFDPNTYGGNNYNPAFAASGVIGRYFKAGATFNF